MVKGCLALLFGMKDFPARDSKAQKQSAEMNEGDMHSGPGGYEGMDYVGGYAAEYRADQEHLDAEEYREH